jgi:hypothetical protein
MASNTTPTKTSSAHPDRPTQADAIKTIKDAKTRPLFIASGKATELATVLKKYGNKQLQIVVI